jgi:TolB protein
MLQKLLALRALVVLLIGLCWLPAARAALEIQVIGGADNKIALALPAFVAAPGQPTPSLTEIIAADLARSGQFSFVSTTGSAIPTRAAEVNHAHWQGKGADALVIGQVVAVAGGRFEVRFRLFDTVRKTQLAALGYQISREQWRATAHQIANVIYEKLTGVKGAFDSRIAYVQKVGKRYELKVADADGAQPRSVVRSTESIISPAFSPDGSKLAYVSFEDKKPIVYVQSLADGKRTRVAAFKGSNSAPAWSPDGRHLAVTLTRDGGSQIFLVPATGGTPKRLSRSSGIDTEAVFSSNGQALYFTSDRGGSPQIYTMPASGGEARRVSFTGSYNVSPTVSPDGRFLAYISRDGGRFQVTLHELASGQTRVLTDSARDESPNFAPNSQTVLYATVLGGQGVLGTVTLDGKTRARLSEPGVDAREPAWGP